MSDTFVSIKLHSKLIIVKTKLEILGFHSTESQITRIFLKTVMAQRVMRYAAPVTLVNTKEKLTFLITNQSFIMTLNILKILMNLQNNTALNLIYNQKIFYIFYVNLHSIFLHQLLLACYDISFTQCTRKQDFHPSPKILSQEFPTQEYQLKRFSIHLYSSSNTYIRFSNNIIFVHKIILFNKSNILREHQIHCSIYDCNHPCRM